jgi:valyl-tRNA synthetase
LGHVLDVLLRVLHPITPFVTEAMWTTLTGDESVVIAQWPEVETSRIDTRAEATVAELQRVVTEVRRFRSDQGLKPGQRVAARVSGTSAVVADYSEEIRTLARLTPAGDGFTPTASLDLGTVTVELDLSGAIDIDAERRRLEKDLAAAQKELDQVSKKLGNEQFLSKAPEHVVAKMHERESAAGADIERLASRIAALPVSP